MNLFKVGDLVWTVQPLEEPAGYASGARAGNQWGREGRILEVQGGHGVCYRVQHWEPASMGWYEPGELRLTVAPQKALTLWALLDGEPQEGS